MEKYAYFSGALLFFLIWIFLFSKRKDLREEMVWAGFLGLPFGLIELFFVPNYWNPLSLFGLMERYGFGIEGFIYAFSIGGIAAVVYEFLEKRRVQKISRRHHLAAFCFFLAIFFTLELVFPGKPMLNLAAAFVGGSLWIAVARPDLIKQILSSGAAFGILYFLVLCFINFLFNDFVSIFYTPQIFNNFKFLGVPIEEILGAVAGGAFWSVLYEYALGYRDVRLRKKR